ARPGGWVIAWGDQVDVRVITMRGENSVTDAMVAAYLAKYSTKGTEATGHASARITGDTIDLYASPEGTHAQRLIHSCLMLGKSDGFMFGKTHGWDSLRRWAHMLGFGGHFLTKGRRYSVNFGALRDVRVFYRRNETTGPEHDPTRTADHIEETTLIIGNL